MLLLVDIIIGAGRGGQDGEFTPPWIFKKTKHPLALGNVLNWNSLSEKLKISR